MKREPGRGAQVFGIIATTLVIIAGFILFIGVVALIVKEIGKALFS